MKKCPNPNYKKISKKNIPKIGLFIGYIRFCECGNIVYFKRKENFVKYLDIPVYCKEHSWKRNCPGCGTDIEYKSKYTYLNAIEKESKCRSCITPENFKTYNKGRKRSEETKKKISSSLIGIKRSEETKKKISNSLIKNKSRVGSKNSMYGNGYRI